MNIEGFMNNHSSVVHNMSSCADRMDINDYMFIKETTKPKLKRRKSKNRIRQAETLDEDKQLIVNSSFPPRVSRNVQSLLEYRLQLMSKYPFSLKSGDCMMVDTNCCIQADADGCMYVKTNTNIPLLCEEHYVKCENNNLSLKMFNSTENTINIPGNVCIGYLIIML